MARSLPFIVPENADIPEVTLTLPSYDSARGVFIQLERCH